MRLSSVAIDGLNLQRLLTTGADIRHRIMVGIPAGAVFVRSAHDAFRGISYLFFTHETFPEVAPGGVCPEIIVEIMSLREVAKLEGAKNQEEIWVDGSYSGAWSDCDQGEGWVRFVRGDRAEKKEMPT